MPREYKLTPNMLDDITIRRATLSDAHSVSILVGELLHEIMTEIGIKVFNFNIYETVVRLEDFIESEKYFVFVAEIGDNNLIGFLSLYEGYALYTEGAFGTIPELYVKPDYRSKKVGHDLLKHAKSFGNSRNLSRLEVTTPPLPEFDKTLSFYEREGFTITGGRKLKAEL